MTLAQLEYAQERMQQKWYELAMAEQRGVASPVLERMYNAYVLAIEEYNRRREEYQRETQAESDPEAVKQKRAARSEAPSSSAKREHAHNQVRKIDKETTNTDTSSAKGEQSEDVTALSTQELTHSEGAANGHQSEDVTAVSTQELAHAKEEEHVPKPEDVTEINTQ